MKDRDHTPRAGRGFTLLELIIALALLGLMTTIMFGSLRFAGRSSDAGDAKARDSSNMRLAGSYLRAQLAAQHTQRMHKIEGYPLLFGGDRDELRYTATLPGRVGLSGVWYYRLHLVDSDKRDSRTLVLERMLPDLNAVRMPEFTESERSILADDVKEVRFAYLGRDPLAAVDTAPTWRDQWDDKQQMPLLIRADVTPTRGQAWPTLIVAPREALEAGCRAWDPLRAQCRG